MKRFFLLLPFLFAASITVNGQGDDLKSLIDKLSQTVTVVQTASKKYEPKIEFIPPAVVRYSYNEIDNKGATTNNMVEFNLADIDVYTVRDQPQKDLMQVILSVKRKQKLVKTGKNNQIQPYSDQVEIFAVDIDNSRAISDIIKKAIPPAEKAMESRLKITTYDAMINFLTSNVKNVTLNDRSYAQVLTKGEKTGSLRFVQTENTGKAAVEETSVFNLADINPNSVMFKISGNKMAITMETLGKSKFIGVSKDGAVKPYVNELTIYANGVDEARDLITVFSKASSLSADNVKNEINQGMNSEKEALDRFAALTGDVTKGTKQISQSITASCICTFSQKEQDAKTTKKTDYKFNWMDVNFNATKIEVSGDQMYIELVSNNNKKLFMETVDEKFTGYGNDIKVYFPHIEHARRAKVALDKAAEKCKASYRDPFANDQNSMLTWIKSNVKEITLDGETLVQKLEPVEGEKSDKLKFSRRTVSAKGGSAEEIFEFSISDINPLSLEINVKGKWMYVSMETNYKSKIIKYYKDGKPMPYGNTVEFAINDVEVSRNMMTAIKNVIKVLKPN